MTSMARLATAIGVAHNGTTRLPILVVRRARRPDWWDSGVSSGNGARAVNGSRTVHAPPTYPSDMESSPGAPPRGMLLMLPHEYSITHTLQKGAWAPTRLARFPCLVGPAYGIIGSGGYPSGRRPDLSGSCSYHPPGPPCPGGHAPVPHQPFRQPLRALWSGTVGSPGPRSGAGVGGRHFRGQGKRDHLHQRRQRKR